MAGVRVLRTASHRIDEIYRHTRERWGEAQADRYIQGLFDSFAVAAGFGSSSRPIPAELGVVGYVYRYERHFVYWRELSDGDIGIVTVLHERMHQIERLKNEFS